MFYRCVLVWKTKTCLLRYLYFLLTIALYLFYMLCFALPHYIDKIFICLFIPHEWKLQLYFLSYCDISEQNVLKLVIIFVNIFTPLFSNRFFHRSPSTPLRSPYLILKSLAYAVYVFYDQAWTVLMLRLRNQKSHCYRTKLKYNTGSRAF